MHSLGVTGFYILGFLSGARSQSLLTQPPSESVSPGNTVKLSYTMSSEHSISDSFTHWYQQKPGTPPRYQLTYKSESQKFPSSGLPTRFSGSEDTSRNAAYLTIAGALAEDEAVYYCEVFHNNAQHSSSVRQKSPLPVHSQAVFSRLCTCYQVWSLPLTDKYLFLPFRSTSSCCVKRSEWDKDMGTAYILLPTVPPCGVPGEDETLHVHSDK